MPTTLETAALGFADATATAVQSVAGAAADAEALLNILGWTAPPGVDVSKTLAFDVTDLVTKIQAVVTSTPEEQQDTAVMTERYAALLLSVGNFVEALDALAQQLPQALAGAGDYIAKSKIDKDLPQRLLDFVLVSALASGAPLAARALTFLGILVFEEKPADPSIYQSEHTRITVAYDRIALLVDPAKLFQVAYGWGTPSFDARSLLMNAAPLLRLLGLTGGVTDLDPELETQLDGATGAPSDPSPRLAASYPIAIGPAAGDVGVSVHRVRASASSASDAGLELIPYARGTLAAEIPLSTRTSLEIVGDLNASGGFAVAVRPGKTTVRTGIFAGAAGGGPSGSIGAGARIADPGGPLELLSAPGGTRLETEALMLLLGVAFDSTGADLFAAASVSGGRLVVHPVDDGFLTQILPKDGLKVGFELGARWSSRAGLRFDGSAGLHVLIPIGKSLGPIDLASVTIDVGAGPTGLTLAAGATGDVTLGPARGSIDRLGVLAAVAPRRGNLGPVDVKIGFRPPNGVGLSIDSASVTGGGFLYFDDQQAQYAGALHLDIEGISLNAIGILTTRLPNNQPGFSLLIIISAKGFTPIQLGFGFSLTGVGGLLGINRDVSTPALQAGMKSHALDSILLSKDDPVLRMPQIIQQLQTVFPPAADSYVFGPMAQISWGTPTVLTIDVALLIRLPAPVRLYVLGRLRAFLPTDDTALVRLNMDVLGVVDFGKGTIAIDAVLYDSKILAFALTGGMALRASWREDPSFALAVGGFNPRFVPPPGFPQVDRLALTLSSGDNPRFRVAAYLALTSNTVQFGADADFRIALGDVALAGRFGFDALIQLAPFEFVVDIRASLALTYKGTPLLAVSVQMTLTGPVPLRARGVASFTILFFTISVAFDVTLVEGQKPPAPEPIDVWAEHLKPELEDSRSWVAQLPTSTGQIVTLALASPSAKNEIVCHPLGTLSVHQRTVPFDRDLDRFGSRGVKGGRRFTVRDLTLGGVSYAASLTKVLDEFAPAQFREMSDGEKLRAPSFESMTAGVAAGSATAAGTPIVKVLGYETIIVRNGTASAGKAFTPPADRIPELAQAGAAAGAQTRTTGRAKYHNRSLGIEIGSPDYVVATKTGLREAAAGDGTYAGAAEALRAYLAANPDEAGDLQIVRRKELA